MSFTAPALAFPLTCPGQGRTGFFVNGNIFIAAVSLKEGKSKKRGDVCVTTEEK